MTQPAHVDLVKEACDLKLECLRQFGMQADYAPMLLVVAVRQLTAEVAAIRAHLDTLVALAQEREP